MTALRRIGDREVFSIGFGAMTLTQRPGYDATRGRAAVHAALEAGVSYFDTADVYGPAGGGDGVNEEFLMAAIRGWPGDTSGVLVGTKAGHVRYPETDTWWIDGRREHLRRACLASMHRLGLDPLPLLHHHRPDPRVPYAESMLALRDLHDDGLVRRIGISNVTVAQARTALRILGERLVVVQNEYSPATRTAEADRLIAWCARHDIAFLAWGPFGGMRRAKETVPRWEPFARVARAHGIGPYRVVLAWLLARAPIVIPIPGASRPDSVRDSVAAADVHLGAAEIRLLDEETSPNE